MDAAAGSEVLMARRTVGRRRKAPGLATGSVGTRSDKNAEIIASTLGSLAKAGGLRIPRDGYLIKRGRGRVIVTRAGSG